MGSSPEDRLALETQIALAAEAARSGSWRTRLRFYLTFHPHRVLALLRAVEEQPRHHVREVDAYEMELQLARDCRAELERKLERVQNLVPLWKARTPGVNNGWAGELEDALSRESLVDLDAAPADRPLIYEGGKLEPTGAVEVPPPPFSPSPSYTPPKGSADDESGTPPSSRA